VGKCLAAKWLAKEARALQNLGVLAKGGKGSAWVIRIIREHVVVEDWRRACQGSEDFCSG
jgi:hypothetical protein